MKAVKFTFDTSFDGATPQEAARSNARSRKSYSAAEIETLRVSAYEEGRQSGDVRAAQALAASIGQVAAAVVQAIAAMEVIRGEAADLAFLCAKKLAGAALKHAPEAEIAETLRIALHQAAGEPRVVVNAPPALAHALEARAAEIAAQEGFDGRMQFVSDPSLHDADCRIEWRGGGIEHAVHRIEEALAEAIARRFPPRNKE